MASFLPGSAKHKPRLLSVLIQCAALLTMWSEDKSTASSILSFLPCSFLNFILFYDPYAIHVETSTNS